MFSLWVLTILVIFAVCLGRQAFLDLKLAEYQRDKLKASVWASGGIAQAIAVLEKDAVDAKTKDYDIIQECGVNLNGKEPREIFSYSLGKAGEGFAIGREDASGEFVYGLNDEEGKININGTSELDRKKIEVLLRESLAGESQELAAAVINWMSAGNANEAKKEEFSVPEELQTALEYFYRNQGYPAALSRGRAREVYGKIKGVVTIYGDAKVNINTAPDEALRIFILAVAENVGQTYSDVPRYSEAGSRLFDKLIELRQSAPLKTDADISLGDLTGEEEVNIFAALRPYLKVRSDVFLISASGKSRGIRHYISAVYNRKEQRIVYWHES